MRLTLIGLLCLIGTASPSHAECVLLRFTDYLRTDQIAAIFRGTAREVTQVSRTGQVVTFAVDRVWKGEVTRTFTISNRQDIDGIAFERGRAYLVFARRQTPTAALFGIGGTEPPEFATTDCGAYPAANAHRIVGSRPGYAPRPGGQ